MGSGRQWFVLSLHTTGLQRLISEWELRPPAGLRKADKRVTFGLIQYIVRRPHLDPRAHEGKEEEYILEPTTPSNQSRGLLEVLQHEVCRFERNKRKKERDDSRQQAPCINNARASQGVGRPGMMLVPPCCPIWEVSLLPNIMHISVLPS